MSNPRYFDLCDPAELVREYPLGDEFTQRFVGMSRDELHQLQEQRFLRLMQRGWQIPFYQRLWRGAGVEPGDIKGLQDIGKLPVYSKSDLMRSVEEYPPFGDFHGMDSLLPDGRKPPVVLQTTSGTTGRPQPLIFGPRGREIQSILAARTYLLQGLRDDDVVHSVYGYGMINGGHYIREALLHYTGAVLLSAGTGAETRSLQQVQLMSDFGATVLIGFADYFKRLADVAREAGIEPGRDIPLRMICGHIGRESRERLSELWGGVTIADWYGVGDTGSIAAEGPDHDGLYVWEDAQYLELLDPDSNEPVAEGQAGNMVVTCLHKDDIFPCIRFNTCDLSRELPGTSALGLSFKRIEGFLGRSDNMVKVRGINVYPQALGPILEDSPHYGGEFICVVTRDSGGREALEVRLEIAASVGDRAAANDSLKALLRSRVGIECEVTLCAAGELSTLTQVESRQKPIRLIDNREG